LRAAWSDIMPEARAMVSRISRKSSESNSGQVWRFGSDSMWGIEMGILGNRTRLQEWF
jgi:hypothetical protein